MTWNQATALALCSLTLTAAVGCSGGGSGGRASPGTTDSPVPAASPATALEQQYAQVVNAVLPSVVQITTEGGEGSGVVFDDQGHVVTNAHVVAGEREAQVTSATGGAALRGTIVGSFTPDDLAVVKVDGGSLRPARFADSGGAKVGQIVLAMGNPLGLNGSVSNGIVSALNRTVSTGGEGGSPGATISNAIQTSAPINPGNSGGALVTLSGEVLGIPTAAASDPSGGSIAPGIGFATPSNTVRTIVPQLIRDGRVTHSGRAALGVTVRTVLDPDSSDESAVGIVEVEDGGPAADAGIRAGEMILSVNGTPTPTQTQLSEVLAQLEPGAKTRVEIQSPDGRERTVEVTLGELPDS